MTDSLRAHIVTIALLAAWCAVWIGVLWQVTA